MVLLHYLIAIAIILTGILISFYFILSPLNRPVLRTNYPYSLSLNPSLTSAGSPINISVSTLRSDITLENLGILVVNPLSKKFPFSLDRTDYKTITYPDTSANMILGNYSVLLVSYQNNKTLVSSYFEVVLLPPYLYSFGGFAFGSALPLTVALIVSIISTVYQLFATRNSDRNRLLQDKSQWMIDNGKYYIELVRCALKICRCFEEEYNLETFDKKNLFYEIVNFYHEYIMKFKENVGMLYFDDVHSEFFITNVLAGIFDMYKEIMNGDHRRFLQFTNWIDQPDVLKDNSEFQKYIDSLHRYLTTTDGAPLVKGAKRADRFYKYHLIFWIVLYKSTNETFVITYSRKRALEREMYYKVKDKAKKFPALEETFRQINERFYGDNEDLKLELRFHNRNLFRKRFSRRDSVKKCITTSFSAAKRNIESGST
jgi:hypothetical protein